MEDHVWYAAYGSNLLLDRLTRYLEGGAPPGASLACPGARDPSPPLDVRPLELTGSVYFAWESATWGGGIAFYDPYGEGASVGRAYLLTREQLSDVVAQEMHRPPGADLDLGELLSTGRCAFGEGRYETMHVVGAIDGEPVVTFTGHWDGPVPYNEPSPAYLTQVGHGLQESQGWDLDQVTTYLLARPGIGSWTPEAVHALLTAPPG